MILQKFIDIFFLSYDETNREINWRRLKSKFPQSRRIHGVKGLALAHQMCARMSKSSFFFVVNGDNKIFNTFHFQLPEQPLDKAIYVWRSLNPVNQLMYGFGGVKLFPCSAFLSSLSCVDMSTSLRATYKIISQPASVTCFNASPLEAWRGAFRECVKLSSQCIVHQKSFETEQRLSVWCEKGGNKPFGSYVLLGARQGRDYGKKFKDDLLALNKINDFFWLKNFFLNNVQKSCS